MQHTALFLVFFHLASSLQSVTNENLSRRRMVAKVISTMLISTAGATVSLADPNPSPNQDPTTVGRKLCTTDVSPSTTIVTCQGGVSSPPHTSLLPISANANGVSTSSVKNPMRFSPPWSYSTATNNADVAWKSLLSGLREAGGKEVETMTGVGDDGEFR